MKFYKYHGAGNDFLLADNRNNDYRLDTDTVRFLCDRHIGFGADGLMLLESSESYAFRMEYFNSDGSGGMMCGNGGRCIVAFAAHLGIKDFNFIAPDGEHRAELLSLGKESVVRLQMKDVLSYEQLSDNEYFLDTGTRHFVRFVEDVESYKVLETGRNIRYETRFAPIGTNVNFVQPYDEGIKVRTYEKGVEDETLACGTGIVASSMASYLHGFSPIMEGERISYKVSARIAELKVDFLSENGRFTDVWLTGPATLVGCIEV